ncbi:AHH domain-containing protein [Algicola sagamiensis]|uniref:AHH domain-containing protein n=1 Tax=Algicola sagamiensis TaxID=163869 RepID=UPI00037BCB31|nr:AHH domain-containing protein [Algicola sagamiensis]
MKPEYIPTPRPARPSEPTPLDMAIYNFQLKAAEFHDKRNKAAPINESPAARKERVQKRDRDMEHLLLEQRKIEAHAKIQRALKNYQEDNLSKDPDELLDEAHHPTARLAKYLTANGEPKPTVFHEAHHIIPGKGRFLQEEMLTVRLNLHTYGVGINDPKNGVWLANYLRNKQDDWATPDAPAHRQVHGYNYENWLYTNLGIGIIPEQIFLGRLRVMKRQLKDGSQPSQVTAKKDINWDGR